MNNTIHFELGHEIKEDLLDAVSGGNPNSVGTSISGFVEQISENGPGTDTHATTAYTETITGA